MMALPPSLAIPTILAIAAPSVLPCGPLSAFKGSAFCANRHCELETESVLYSTRPHILPENYYLIFLN